MNNPLLLEFDGYRGTPRFDLYSDELYMPAFSESLDLARAELKTLENDHDSASFENTIERIDALGKVLGRVSSVFFNLEHAETTDKLQEIAQEVSPLLSEFNNDIYLSEKLFAKVKSVYDSCAGLDLTVEQKTLLDNTYRSFVNNGALLSVDDKVTFRSITSQLSTLGIKFGQNVLAETNAFSLHLTDEADLAGLPESAVTAASESAREKKIEGWLFNLQFPSYFPFLQYADNRSLREKMFRAYSTRCNANNEYENKSIVAQIVNLKLQKSKLLGFSDYSAMVLLDRMAGSQETVFKFLDDLLAYALPAGRKDKDEVAEFARSLGADFELQRWDWAYYSEKLKEARYQITDEMTRPYFELSKVVDAVFKLANQLYGISFVPTDKMQVYHSDVKCFEVLDENGVFLSSFYADFHPRATKQGGAWMTSFQDQHIENGIDIRPCIAIVCNFTKPTADQPALITFGEVETLLHEFGHALHGILSRCCYQSLSGTSVFRDFVELPSQIMENWATEPEWLQSFAIHYQTGEPMPTELIEKIVRSRNFQSGYHTLRQLSFGIIDMAWHSIKTEFDGDLLKFESANMGKTELFPAIEGSLFSSAFSHIFGGGYAAGYYGYKWAEVLDADAFNEFKKYGIFDKATAKKFRECILEKGGSEHPMKLYRQFKGADPTVDALLKRSGLK